MYVWGYPSRQTLQVIGFVNGGYGLSSTLWTPLQTLLINPDNLPPLQVGVFHITNDFDKTFGRMAKTPPLSTSNKKRWPGPGPHPSHSTDLTVKFAASSTQSSVNHQSLTSGLLLRFLSMCLRPCCTSLQYTPLSCLLVSCQGREEDLTCPPGLVLCVEKPADVVEEKAGCQTPVRWPPSSGQTKEEASLSLQLPREGNLHQEGLLPALVHQVLIVRSDLRLKVGLAWKLGLDVNVAFSWNCVIHIDLLCSKCNLDQVHVPDHRQRYPRSLEEPDLHQEQWRQACLHHRRWLLVPKLLFLPFQEWTVWWTSSPAWWPGPFLTGWSQASGGKRSFMNVSQVQDPDA